MSDPVSERLDSLRARLILSAAVVSFHYHQEETVGDVGYFRVRCTLIDGSELQLLERFRAAANVSASTSHLTHDQAVEAYRQQPGWGERSIRPAANRPAQGRNP